MQRGKGGILAVPGVGQAVRREPYGVGAGARRLLYGPEDGKGRGSALPEAGRAAGRRAVLTFGGGVRVRSRAGKGGTRGRCPVAHKKSGLPHARQAVESARCGRSGSPRSGNRRRVLQEGDYCFCTVMERAAGASGCLRGMTMVSTPFLWLALMFSTSASSARPIWRQKEP